MDIFVENLFRDQDCGKFAIPAFFVKSTAPPNVEDDTTDAIDVDQPTIQDVIELLYTRSKTGIKDLGVVVAIHGYNTGADMAEDGVRDYWYKPLSTFVNNDSSIKNAPCNSIFLGYRWPSESMKKVTLRQEARGALPIVLAALLYGGIGITIISLIIYAFTQSPIAVIMALLSTLSFSIVLSLYLLRLTLYFRDSYRATMYGVSDLVELIRQLDQGLVERQVRDHLADDALYDRLVSKIPALTTVAKPTVIDTLAKIQVTLSKYPDLVIESTDPNFQGVFQRLRQDVDTNISDDTLLSMVERLVLIETLGYDEAQRYWQNHRIRLSFIGHSMGGHVTTQVIRILSDVFDPRSVGRVGKKDVAKVPSARVGRVFRLGRLVLVSPDIPLLTITSGRSNFLRSALRRFEEAYLFSNEGDLALRLASTTANYFSFPAKTRTQGYRLGNLTVSPKHLTTSKSRNIPSVYGILNLEDLPNPNSHLLPYLEVNVLSKNKNQRLDPASQQQEQRETKEAVASVKNDDEAIADLFSYFDCTEYKDWQSYPSDTQKPFYHLILNDQKSPLKFFDYLRLFQAYASGKRDVHGGYFQAPFIKILMYRLAFVGFTGLLDSLLQADPVDLGILDTPLPEPLKADLEQARSLANSPTTSNAPAADDHLLLKEQRIVALHYFSWLCAQKQIQAAVSPERYQVDVLGHQREEVREAMLLNSSDR